MYSFRKSIFGLQAMPTSFYLRQRNAGFTLVEMAMVLVIIGLLAGIMLPLTSTMRDQQRRKEAANKLAIIDQAILSYVTTNKRLPCPADGATPSGTLNGGVSQPAVAGDCAPLQETRGVVPWATLGLTEADVIDPWGVRITYRVPSGTSGFTRINALNATQCDPAGTRVEVGPLPYSCAIGCTSADLTTCTSPLNFLTGRGLMVQDEAATRITNPAMATGAAYILISHAALGGGGYNSAGNLTASGAAAGANEVFNQNNAAIRLMPLGYYHGSGIVEREDINTHFDDILSHPTLMTILTKAQLGPRIQP